MNFLIFPKNILVSADIIGKLEVRLSLCKPRRYVWERRYSAIDS